MRKIIINCNTNSIDEFRQLCKYAKEVGITHVVVSQIEKSIWQWDLDRNDPYPNWAMYNPSIFKFVVPDKLKKYLPCDYAERNLNTLIERAKILEEFGLQGAFEGMEPAWLPEAVFREHPSWRGPRCDQTRRSRKEYYAPCVDNPEVIEMYEEAIAKLCKIANIAFFQLMTKDSGSGFCWQEGLYPGKNGPSFCQNLTTAERAVNFLSLIQRAAKSVGVDAEVGYKRYFSPQDIEAIKTQLKENQFCVSGGVKINNVGYPEHEDPTFPIKSIPLVGYIADGMLNVAEDDENTVYIKIPDMTQKTYFEFIKNSMGVLKNSVCSKYEVLKMTAQKLIGDKYADRLVDIWDSIDKAQDRMRYLNYGGHMLQLGTVHQRWITRPLVPFPERLTDEEKKYFRPYIFQAGTEKDAENMLNMQGTVWLGGESGYRLIDRTLIPVNAAVNRAISIIVELIAKDDIGDYKSELEELLLRLKMYNCVLKNAKNVIRFQTILDRTDTMVEPEDTSPAIDEQGDPRWYKMSELIRNEIDNSIEMIELIDKSNGDLLVCTETEENEDIMHLGPDIKEDLLRKIEIMHNHKYEINELYKSYNV